MPLTVVAPIRPPLDSQSHAHRHGQRRDEWRQYHRNYSNDRHGQSLAGSYDIVPSINDPGSRLANYVVSLSDGTLTVTQAVLTVSADAQSRLYGTTNPF